MTTVVAIFALIIFAVAIVGIVSLGMLAVFWGPAALAAFQCFVTLHQGGADGLTTFGLTLLTFIVVRILTGLVVRAGLRAVGMLRVSA